MKILLRVSFLVVLFSMVLSFGYSLTAEAQCPTDIEPTSVPWTTASRHLMYGTTGCGYIVNFCSREITTGPTNEWQYFIFQIIPDPLNSNCDPIDPQDLMKDAVNFLSSIPAAIDPCNARINSAVYRAICWKLVMTGPNEYEYDQCSEGTYCEKSSMYDCDEITHQPIVVWSGYDVIGPNTHCLKPHGQLILNQCYTFDCEE